MDRKEGCSSSVTVARSHPRYRSLKTREMIARGVELGITSIHGLIAHGRGEAFDYLIGEKTRDFAYDAISAAARMLRDAAAPVISVNGNACALCAKELVQISNALKCPLEVNIFHASGDREKKIHDHLIRSGAKNVLMPIKSIVPVGHNRKRANPEGIGKADVVFVPLEDGDRCRALRKMGKEVITIDLNPMSRTARDATITIVDNIVRAMPNLQKELMKGGIKRPFSYSNIKSLRDAERAIRQFPNRDV